MVYQYFLLVFLSLAFTNPTRASYPTSGSWITLDGNGVQLITNAAKNGQDTFIIEAVGTMFGNNGNTVTCYESYYNISQEALIELTQIFSAASKLGLSIQNLYVGAVTLATGATAEWGACGPNYAKLYNQAAIEINDHLTKEFSSNLPFNWYIAQEPDLNVIPFVNPECNADGETTYFMLTSAYLRASFPTKNILFSPYWFYSTLNQNFLAQSLNTLLTCASNITHCAPQDGVGSFNNSLEETSLTYAAFSANFPPGRTLWANCETFMYKADICNAAPVTRVQQQVQSVQQYVKKIVNWWAYNLPGAPACTP